MKVLFALLSYLLSLKSLKALLLNTLYLFLELVHRARQVILEDSLSLESEEIIALLLKLHTFLDAHVGPRVLDVRNTPIIDGCKVGLKHGQVHWSI